MISLELGIHPLVIQKFENIQVGGFIATHLHRAINSLPQEARHQAIKAQESLRMEGLNLQNLVSDERIAAWRNACGRSGLKPGKYKSSAEQLARRFLKGGTVNTSIPLVDLYCAVSARYLAPLGGYDVEGLPGPGIDLRLARAEVDSFTPIFGSAHDMPLSGDVVVYASLNEVLCYSFNHRDSRSTCLKKDTSKAVFLGESITDRQLKFLTTALNDMSGILECSAATIGEIQFTNAREPRVLLTAPD